MARRGCDCPDILVHACSLASSDCVAVAGAGSTADPWTAEWDLDADVDNIITCGSGLAATIPTVLTNPPAVLASTPIAQTINNSSTTTLSFNRERFDTDTMHSEAANTSRITMTTAGVYLISGWVIWSGHATGERRVDIITGGNTIAQDERVTMQDDFFSHPFQSIWKFAAAEYFEVQVHQNSGATLQVDRAWVGACRVAKG